MQARLINHFQVVIVDSQHLLHGFVRRTELSILEEGSKHVVRESRRQGDVILFILRRRFREDAPTNISINRRYQEIKLNLLKERQN